MLCPDDAELKGWQGIHTETCWRASSRNWTVRMPNCSRNTLRSAPIRNEYELTNLALEYDQENNR
jgi:hypothetical protein